MDTSTLPRRFNNADALVALLLAAAFATALTALKATNRHLGTVLPVP